MAKYQYLHESNVTSLSGIFVYIQVNEPLFMPIILSMIFSIITMASFFSQRRMTGNANFWGSATIGAWITTLSALILSMVNDGQGNYLVTMPIVFTCIGITALFSIFFFFRNDEF